MIHGPSNVKYNFINLAISIFAWGAESWNITNKMERDLITGKRKILRNVCRPRYENVYWRTKMYQEIYINLNLQII